MELIDNVNKTLKDDLSVSIQKDSKVSIAAACFSIYAFQELKRELKNIEELRFIFTSPTFIKEKTKKVLLTLGIAALILIYFIRLFTGSDIVHIDIKSGLIYRMFNYLPNWL